MSRIFFIALLFSWKSAFSQLTDSISKIIFHYDKGYYPFGNPGQYSVSEIIEYSKTNNNFFLLTSHIQIKRSVDSTKFILSIDTLRKNISEKTINKERLENIFKELNTSKNNFNANFVRPYLNKISRKDVRVVLMKYDLNWKFEDEYSDREDRKRAYRELKAYFKIDSFLLYKQPDIDYQLVIMDVWDNFSIICFKGEDTISYRQQFFELYGQPVSKYINNVLQKRIINLQINNVIKQLLPSNSLIGKKIDLNQIKEEYIKWYLSIKM